MSLNLKLGKPQGLRFKSPSKHGLSFDMSVLFIFALQNLRWSFSLPFPLPFKEDGQTLNHVLVKNILINAEKNKEEGLSCMLDYEKP